MLRTDGLARLLENAPIVGNTKELIGVQFLADKNYIVREPKEPYQTNELHWFISQSRYVQDLKKFAGFIPKIWNDIAESTGLINSNYGWCCLSEENGSQFENAMKHLELDKESRRAIMIYNRPKMHMHWADDRKVPGKTTAVMKTSWHDLLPEDYKNLRGDFMCCQNNHFIIRDNKLIMTVHMRSLDAVFGYNADYIWFDYIFNMAVQYLKKTYPELERGDMIIYADSVHVYEMHWEDLKKEALKDYGMSMRPFKGQGSNPYLKDPDNNHSVKLKPIVFDPMVKNPSHYTQNDMEHWDFVEYMSYPYTLGCATKYVFRNRFKGSQKQDLNKVIQYVEKFIESGQVVVHSKDKSLRRLDLGNKIQELDRFEMRLLEYIDNIATGKEVAKNLNDLKVEISNV